MEKKHRARLLKLAKHLEKGKLGHKKFDFQVINQPRGNNNLIPSSTCGVKPYSCGYAGCAMGECPVAFPRQWLFDAAARPRLRVGSDQEAGVPTFADACAFFGLDTAAGVHLFEPNAQYTEMFGGRRLGPRATKRQVAANIRAFVKVMAKP